MNKIQDHELSLVDNKNNEWRKWYEQGKCSKPLDMSFVNATANEIVLEPN